MKRISKALACLLGMVWSASPASAQTLPPMNAESVQAWADSVFDSALEKKRFSGAVVSFVQDGQLRFSKGYGFADYALGTPVDPASTTFQIGSITKTFTATAIAQLIDRGLIDGLDDPANRYLKRLQLPSPGGHEITLKQLLTHSAGFENRVFNLFSDQTHNLPLSPAELERFAAEVVNEPGRYSSYNNYGTAMLGVVVEDVTGITIADYLQQNLFRPLRMDHTVLNMTPEPTPGQSVSYGFLPSGEPLRVKQRSIHPFFAPVGGVNATAVDMGHFMIAQLDAGRTPAGALMSPAAFSLLHARLAGNHPLSSGFGMIFFIWDWNDHTLILHGGDLAGTHSGMVLIPELNAGLFFSMMADFPEVPPIESIMGSERLHPVEGVLVETPLANTGVITDYLVHFLGAPQAHRQAGFIPGDATEYTGNYVGQSAPASTMEVLLNLISPFETVRVTAAGEGGLLINGKGPYEEISPGVFWSEPVQMALDGSFLDSPLFFFSRDKDGAVDYLTPQIGFDAWVKKGLLETPTTYLNAWLVLGLVLLTGLLCLFYPKVPANAFYKWIPVLIALGIIAMPLVLLVGYAGNDSPVDQLFFGRGNRFLVFAILANLIGLLALASAWFTFKAWRDRYWAERRPGLVLRLHCTLLSVAALLIIPVFHFCRLLII